jgi:hypothetical protein
MRPPSYLLLLLIFPFLHWHTRFSDSISPSLCFFSVLFSFLSSFRLVSCTFPFHRFCLQTLSFSFPLSLSAFSSYILPSLCKPGVSLSTPSTSVKYFSCTFSTSSCSQISAPHLHQYTLYHALKHHHSPPKITSPLSLSYSPKHPTTLFAFLIISLICALSVALSLVTQIFELVYLFYFPSSQFHTFSSVFLILLLNTIIFVFSIFTFSFFCLTYFPRFSFISRSPFATITKLSTNARRQTFSLDWISARNFQILQNFFFFYQFDGLVLIEFE